MRASSPARQGDGSPAAAGDDRGETTATLPGRTSLRTDAANIEGR
ncbi:hypothetical protein [Streptomyces sp. NPDC088254]